MLANISEILKHPGILAPSRHIFLMSHMRAYTSLFGHIMGSNPTVCGYYEMHIGYYSWKSFLRQKLLYFKEEEPKQGFRYMFDKVLHNEHYVAPDILNNKHSRTIFCLRQPQDSIPSIVKLYQKIDPSHEFNSEPFATNYYIQRLLMLEKTANELKGEFFYLDAESIKQKPEESLAELSNWLELTTPLSTTYELQKNTSKKRYGDTSEKLQTGHINNEKSAYTNFQFDQSLISNAANIYTDVRETLIRLSSHNSIADLAD